MNILYQKGLLPNEGGFKDIDGTGTVNESTKKRKKIISNDKS